MPKIVVTQKAQKHIDEIIENIVEYTNSLESGFKLFNDLNDKISLIGFMPQAIGRLREDGSREAFCRGYRIVYINFVIHSRRIYSRP
ncbi:type II toxin-antitoxin system RelE/ParE family toxin [Rodentibacter myodis]|uniref:Plasmid stabilization system protein n=1 Tax=Rodentibacter myodis TaxID=1907939 RepID=A0A1V3JPK3_9PAST|nr:type II toxin-antitoxin system RelE/ParE family toxin [Rodentibacter myodis]OOF58182.1 plasmid stabilization system protein [Rodentibacter myodis]